MFKHDKVKIVITNQSTYNVGIDLLGAYENHSKPGCGIPDSLTVTCVLSEREYSIYHLLGKLTRKIVSYHQLIDRIILGYSHVRIDHIIYDDSESHFMKDIREHVIGEIKLKQWYSSAPYKAFMFRLPPNSFFEIHLEFLKN